MSWGNEINWFLILYPVTEFECIKYILVYISLKYIKNHSRLGGLNGNKATCTFTFVIKILASNLITNFEVANRDFDNFWGIAWSHTVNKHVFA